MDEPLLLDDLSDAQALAKRHPTTFQAPKDAWLDALVPGLMVKICRADERFWVRLTKVDGETLVGTVDNVLANPGNQDLPLGMLVAFRRRHVYDIR